jgi:hypothetical protein
MYQRLALTVRRHAIVLTERDGRWTATIDGLAIEGDFATSADAWTAAVGEAERLDGFTAAARMMRR